MRLSKLSLNPFAGFTKRDFAFTPGLNVILGANDVGKSTIFRAIDSALFLPSKVAKSTKDGRDLLPRILPIGGDHARLALEFSCGGASGCYRLEKSWGQGAGVLLELPGGGRLLQEEKVEESLRALLGLPAATFQNVLFMGQGALEGTVGLLQENRESLHSLGDLLRLAVDRTAGISVDRLKDLLAEKIESAFSHWDRQSGIPEKGKGIEDEWKKNVGSILEAYYSREKLKRDAQLAGALENERDRLLAALNAKQAKRAEVQAFVAGNENFVASASERQALEAKIEMAQGECEAMVKDLAAWMQAESDRRSFAPEVARLAEGRLRLDESLKAALAFGKQKELLGRFEKARGAHSLLLDAKQKLLGHPPFKPEDLKRLRTAFQEEERLKNSLRSGKLQLQFQVMKEMEVVLRKDLDGERKGTMTPGKPMTISAGGRIQLESEFFSLQVTSGDGAAAEAEANLVRAAGSLAKLLLELGVQNFEEAQERCEKYGEALQAVKNADALLAGFLGAEKFADLERLAKAAAAVEGAATIRDPELVQAELQSLLLDFAGKKEGLVRSESMLKDLERRHGVSDSASLTEKLIAKKSELSLFEKKLLALPALPGEAGKLEDFLRRFRLAQFEDGALGDAIRVLSVELAELKARLPEQSAQDLERARIEADALFTRELGHGRALLRVEAAVKAVEGQGGDFYSGFRAAFEKQIAALSAGKYHRAKMQEALPDEFERSDGTLVKFSWLSAGTKDAFALGLRLSMASHFLGNAEGFLLLDDPLVNMDPERQEIAAGFLRHFASEKQMLVFTCHPGHAELLGGNCIRV